MTRCLLKNCGFRHVLAGKFNEGVLERFFETICQAGGQNDHFPLSFSCTAPLQCTAALIPQVWQLQEKRVLMVTDLAFQDDEKLESSAAAEI